MRSEPTLLPAALDFIGPEETNNIPILLQILFAEFGIELLRMAAVHTPSPLATALGLVAALLIGEMAWGFVFLFGRACSFNNTLHYSLVRRGMVGHENVDVSKWDLCRIKRQQPRANTESRGCERKKE